MPKGAKLLNVQVQDGVPYLYALANPLEANEPRPVKFYGTGKDIPDADSLSYVGTFQIETNLRGFLVFHVFEVLKPSIITNDQN